MIQDVRFGANSPLTRTSAGPTTSSTTDSGAPAQAAPSSFGSDQLGSSSDSAQAAVFPRNSWQSADAQMQQLSKANEKLDEPYNFRSNAGMKLVHQGGGSSTGAGGVGVAQPVYGMPVSTVGGNLPVGGGAQPVYGKPVGEPISSGPVGGGAQPVYGMPVSPVSSEPIGGGAQPVYGMPVSPIASGPVGGGAQPVYGMPITRGTFE